MPALDFINKTEEKTFDVSAAASASTNAIENSRAGFNAGEGFTAVITEASAANFVDRALNIFLDVSVDNGTTYYPIGVIPMYIGTDGVPLQIKWGPVQQDIVPENYDPASIQWRARATLTSALSTTDDFNFQVYLGNQQLGVLPGLSGLGVS